MFSSRFPGWKPALPGLVAGALAGVLSACSTRDRPTFPTGGTGSDSAGPVTIIDSPTGDTTVTAGPALFVTGRTTDDDGLDTVYVETDGGVTSFSPEVRPASPFRFGYPITTNGLAGDTIIVRIFGTDRLGNRGDTATRTIAVE